MKTYAAIRDFINEMCGEIKYSAKNHTEISSSLLSKKGYAALVNAENRLLRDFLNGLGKTDTGGQIDYCKVFSSRAALQYEKSKAEYERLARLYSVLGICAGLSLAVLLV